MTFFIAINRFFLSAKGLFKVQTKDALITLSTYNSDTVYFNILNVISTTFVTVFIKSMGRSD